MSSLFGHIFFFLGGGNDVFVGVGKAGTLCKVILKR